MSRAALSLMAVVVLSALYAGVRALLPLHLPTPEIALALVLYLAVAPRGALSLQVATALAIGYLSDLQSGAPTGLHALSFAVLSILARGAATRILVVRAWQVGLIAFFGVLGHAFILQAAQIHTPALEVFATAFA